MQRELARSRSGDPRLETGSLSDEIRTSTAACLRLSPHIIPRAARSGFRRHGVEQARRSWRTDTDKDRLAMIADTLPTRLLPRTRGLQVDYIAVVYDRRRRHSALMAASRPGTSRRLGSAGNIRKNGEHENHPLADERPREPPATAFRKTDGRLDRWR